MINELNQMKSEVDEERVQLIAEQEYGLTTFMWVFYGYNVKYLDKP